MDVAYIFTHLCFFPNIGCCGLQSGVPYSPENIVIFQTTIKDYRKVWIMKERKFPDIQLITPTCTVEEDLCFRVVVVDIMVVVSTKLVDISGAIAVVLAEPATLGISPTSLTLPLILMFRLASAAIFNTLRPL